MLTRAIRVLFLALVAAFAWAAPAPGQPAHLMLGTAADFRFGGAAAPADQLIDGKIDAFAAGLPTDAFGLIEDERAVRFIR